MVFHRKQLTKDSNHQRSDLKKDFLESSKSSGKGFVASSQTYFIRVLTPTTPTSPTTLPVLLPALDQNSDLKTTIYSNSYKLLLPMIKITLDKEKF